MRVTDLTAIDPEYRAWHKARTLLNSLSRRYDWYKANFPDLVSLKTENRYKAISAAMQTEVTENTIAWLIEKDLSPQPILKLPVETILHYVFHGLPKPQQAKLSDLELNIADIMTMRGRALAAKGHQFQASAEIAYRARHGWFMIFNTLTVAPGEYYNVFAKQSRAFTDYIRKFDRAAARAAYGSVRASKNQDYHTHFAVTECGTKNGRLHIHCIHFVKALPAGITDPNCGLLRPIRRTLDGLADLWPHGRSQPKPVRYSPEDAYGRIGHRWPIEDGKPLVIKSPQALANYLGKYLQSAFNAPQRENLQWRVKKSHNLGSQLLNEMLGPLSTSTLIILAATDHLKLKLNNSQIPQHLLRRQSLKILQNRPSIQNPKGYSLTALGKLASPRLSPLHYSRASTQTIQGNNRQSTQYLSTLGLGNEASFNAAWRELSNAARLADTKYFPRSLNTGGTTSTRDHIYARQSTTMHNTSANAHTNRRTSPPAKQQ